MRVDKLVLSKYKRLMQSNIQYFEWTPKNRFMLLLGSNGTGKSSILEELTPCPATHDQFEAGGYKEFHCTHKNHTYVLLSNYSGKGTGKHSFIRDGIEELNPGGTFVVQKDLVLATFGLDRAIHEVMSGIVTFTSMPTAKRREWLTKLSPIDLSFVFSQYNIVTSSKRDAQGVIKHKAKRMSSENMDLPNDAEMHEQRQRVKVLSEKLQGLYRYRGSKSIEPTNITDFATHYKDLRQSIKQKLESSPVVPAMQGIRTQDNALSQIAVVEHQIQSVKAQLEDTAQQLEVMRQQQGNKEDYGTPEQIAALNLELKHLTVQRDTLNQQSKESVLPVIKHDVYPHSKGLLAELLSTWSDLITSFPDNVDNYFSHQKGLDARSEFATNRNQLSGWTERHGIAAQRLARLKGCEDITCPQCEHSFQPGVDPTEVVKLEELCAKLADAIAELEQKQTKLKEYIEEFDDYSTYVRQFGSLVRQYDNYKELFNAVVERRMMFTTPRKYLTDIIRWGQAQLHYIEQTETLQRIEQINAQLQRYSAFDRDKAAYLEQQQQRLELQIDKLYIEHGNLVANHRDLKRGIQQVTTYERELGDLESKLNHYMHAVQKQIVNLINQGYDEEIKRTSGELSELQANLHRYELREHTLKDIEREHKESVEWFNDLALLEKALSPKDGLIGKYLMGFMQNLVKLMNAIIGEIWTYPMEVLPSKVDKDELDYNFPMDINNGAVRPPDISKGSSSQRDMVNFAFKLIVMKFLGFDDYPLLLDEFGNTFDEQHRQNLIPFLNRLVEMNQISQIVYISHFNSSHGSFNHAEVVVLDPTNITTPAVYNTTVRFDKAV